MGNKKFISNSVSFKTYKPNNSGQGAASAFEYRMIDGEPVMFIVMASQSGKNDAGNAIFDWQNAINAKMSDVECGDIIAVIEGRKDKAGTDKGLFHKTAGGNKIINFEVGQRGILNLSISSKNAGEKQPRKIFHSFTEAEATCLRIFLEGFLRTLYTLPEQANYAPSQGKES